MNTATWASMEADSGGAVPTAYNDEWTQIVTAITYYRLMSKGHTDSTARCYYPVSMLRMMTYDADAIEEKLQEVLDKLDAFNDLWDASEYRHITYEAAQRIREIKEELLSNAR